jgi:hypothetical protein
MKSVYQPGAPTPKQWLVRRKQVKKMPKNVFRRAFFGKKQPLF